MISGRKIVLIGTGLVGMSYAYGLLHQNLCDELCLIDKNMLRAQGEAMDLNHCLAFSGSNMKIYAGEYADCADAQLIVLAAGVPQAPGESRLDLLKRNAEVFHTILDQIRATNFQGILLVASNPVDIMTRIAQKLSGFPAHRVLGSGTTLDTARLKYLLGSFFSVDPRSVHAYVLGEHGDSEFIPWSQANIANKPVRSICEESHGRFDFEAVRAMEKEVREAAGQIIHAKGATYYGIGMALCRLTRALLGDEHSVLTVSAPMENAYGIPGSVYAGTPCVVGSDGVRARIVLPLLEEERARLVESCAILDRHFNDLGL